MEKLTIKQIPNRCPWSKYSCERCGKTVPAFYILSRLAKGLWVICPKCGTHARPYVPGLKLYHRPSESYLKHYGLPEDPQTAIDWDFVDNRD